MPKNANPGARRWRLRLLAGLALLVAAAGLWATVQWHAAQRPPVTRLALDASYPEMPPDRRHRYLNLPLDYADAAAGSYRAFYALSPGFDPRGPVVFVLTDGQMELVGPEVDFAFFDEQVPGVSYVLIGHRGHSPTLFPEVYRDARLDLRRAMNLYGSWQRVEDIERVRQDMAAAGLLPADGNIEIFGASGAGVLAQQYLQRHGEHVTRALLVSSGAPDLARAHDWTYARNLGELAPDAVAALSAQAQADGVRPGLAYMLFQLGRQGRSGLAALREVVRGERDQDPWPYARRLLRPGLNWPLSRTLLRLPAADAAKVRMYELLGADLRAGPYGYELPLYVWSAAVLRDFLRQDAPLPDLRLQRGRYHGEVLVISGQEDGVFSPAIGQAIASAYPDARFLLVRGGHRLELDRAYQHALRKAFLLHGLHAAETTALLAAPPVDHPD